MAGDFSSGSGIKLCMGLDFNYCEVQMSKYDSS